MTSPKPKPKPRRTDLTEAEILIVYNRALRYARIRRKGELAHDFASWYIIKRLEGAGERQKLAYALTDFMRQEFGRADPQESAAYAKTAKPALEPPKKKGRNPEGDLLRRFWMRQDYVTAPDGTKRTIFELLGTEPYTKIEDDIDRERMLRRIREAIPEKLLWLWRGYYEQGRTLASLGNQAGVSESRICQIWNNLLLTLARKLNP